jgi:choline dehydrogenase-like flavoprotein
MHYVVGSGPSGIACAQALAQSGLPVTILDTGLVLEPEREAVRSAYARRDEASWPAFDLESEDYDFKSGSAPTKYVHGSDYPYRLPPGATEVFQSGKLSLQGSYAAGGLSNVWGSAVLPYRQSDLEGWPISESELRPAFAEVSKLLPIAAEHDDLAELFPLHSAPTASFGQSRQMERFMRSVAKNRSKLKANGITVGKSRLAVDAAGDRWSVPCIYCGRCLHGCPHELIYSSRRSLEELKSRGNVHYLSGVIVRSINEQDESALVHGVKLDGSACVFEAERVFLAAGVLNSTTILLRSQKLYDHRVTIKDSQYFLFPLLQYAASPNVSQERLHTLCQAFVEILDKNISKYTIHLQVYSYSDYIARMLNAKLGAFKCLIPSDALLGRLLVVQGFLHSAHSACITATLKRRETADALYVEALENTQTKAKILQVLRKLRGVTFAIGAIPVSPLLQITEPGRGFHFGGSFPMAQAPQPGQTDRIGRPYGMRRLHLVDASVFPSIAATTITLTVMANAYRIGHEVALLEMGRGA